MQKSNKLTKAVRFAPLLAMALALGACALPRSGPSQSEILAGSVENGGNTHIVLVDDRISRAATVEEPLGFSRSFLNAGLASVDRVRSGDLITVTIWENVENGLLAAVGTSSTTLRDIQVDALGNIFVPYAGIVRASGRTPEELRTEITRLLARQTPDPQVEVRRTAGNGASVNVVGGVNIQGVYPLDAATRRLTAMLASAGGVSLDPAGTRVIVQRGGQSGSVWLSELYNNPENDITLRANDRIIVREDERYFTVLGATTGQKRIDFTSGNPNMVDALADIGGLDSRTADPSGIFIFRVESAEVANAVLETDTFTTPQRLAYVIDLTAQESIFTAQTFRLRNQDTIYITEAPFSQWSRVLEAVAGTIDTFDNLATIAEAL